jgi:hypothetical protein
MEIDIPHAKVFNNQDTESLHHYTTTNASETTQNIVFTTGHNYTHDMIQTPNGAFPCYYCPRRPTNTPLCFMPVSRRHSDNRVIWSPIAHCSLSCVYGTILSEHSYDQIGLFQELYPNVPRPPPRFMFHVPDSFTHAPAMTLPAYDQFIKNDNLLIVKEDPNTYTAFSPIHITRSLHDKCSTTKVVAEYPSYHFYDIGKQEQKTNSELSNLSSTPDIHKTLSKKRNKTS